MAKLQKKLTEPRGYIQMKGKTALCVCRFVVNMN